MAAYEGFPRCLFLVSCSELHSMRSPNVKADVASGASRCIELERVDYTEESVKFSTLERRGFSSSPILPSPLLMASDNNLNEGIITPNDRLINTLEKCFSELIRKQEDHSEKFNKALEVLKPTPPTLCDDGGVNPNDRLTHTLERCFSELMQKQEDQSDKFQQALEALTPKLEALKPKPPVTDKKTAFWNAYKTLADEHDKEFQQKYSTDLDTALIFAGLFSAVDSAFIIQIQPDIQPHGTPLIILVAQNLLYVSLFSTLLAALLAVLGKQWLMHYMAAGERGTIEARGLERQRKFDGLRKWRFDAVMQMFPLLLQVGLFLFSAALSIYLWKIHLSLAVVVLSFTAIGSIAYTTLLISAIASPDSPFQTPLTPLVARLIPSTLSRKTQILFGRVTVQSRILFRHTCVAARRIRCGNNLLPFFKDNTSSEMTKKSSLDQSKTKEQPSLDAIFDKFPTPSPEVPAVAWALETSTDPRTVAAAAGMVIDLQWLGGMDVRPQLSKLHDGILWSFNYFEMFGGSATTLTTPRDGMSVDAMHLAQAYCTLRCVLMSGWLPAQYLHNKYSDSPEDATWVYKALDCIAAPAAGNGSDWDTRTTVGVAGLLSALIYYRAPVDKNHIYIVLRALALADNVSQHAVLLLVSLF
ncbi:hypothetical protein DFH06DRAFT_1468469 [Mycena polygramma]|nr:hypothetical protein DFH06DRAFT_1468469 [Mycena polygramma]